MTPVAVSLWTDRGGYRMLATEVGSGRFLADAVLTGMGWAIAHYRQRPGKACSCATCRYGRAWKAPAPVFRIRQTVIPDRELAAHALMQLAQHRLQEATG